MADIQSAAAEIRRGKKQKPQGKNIMATTAAKYDGLSITMGGYNYLKHLL